MAFLAIGLSQMKRPISVAFQGGGARLIALIAAAEAISELVRDNKIHVEAVSGSSAGSIAALLLASDVDFGQVRRVLRDSESTIGKKFAPINDLMLFIKGLLFAASGAPVFRPNLFNDTIEDILIKVGINCTENIEDVVKIPTYLTVSDIYQGKTVSYDAGNIRDALRKSCAIPFIFASHKSDDRGQYVDGGVFDNLPTDILITKSSVSAPVFAIGFQAEPVLAAKDAFSYFISLISSIVSYKVSNSREIIGDEYVHSIETSLRILDFNKMISVGLNEEYDRVKIKTREFFESWLSGRTRPFETAGRRAVTKLRDTEQKLIKTIESVVNSVPGGHSYVRMVVDANSLHDRHLPDEIKVEQLINVPHGYALPGMIVPLISGDGAHAKTECIIKLDDGDGKDVEFTQFLINDKVLINDVEFDRNSLVVLFGGDVSALSGRSIYILKRETRYGFMYPLSQGADKLTIRAHYWGADELSIQLNLPGSFGAVDCDWIADKCPASPTRVDIPKRLLRDGWIAHAAQLRSVPHQGYIRGRFTLRQTR